MPDTISFARGAPSLDIIDVEGLKEAAARAFTNDPGGTTAYGTSIGYVPLRAWIVERPTYDRTLLALRGRGADVRAVELEPDGIDVSGLANLIADGLAPKLAHIIPNFQNPAGYTLSRDKRDALLDLARDHDFVIFEDDPYVALRFSGETLPTMLSLDRDEKVVYASSFSKT